jgi:protein gp37
MAEYSKIDYLLAQNETEEPGGTWSPWIGCDKGGRAGCAHCWAEMWARRSPRFRGHWGPNAPRYFFGDDHWQLPLRWQRKCERLGRRKRVLVSLCDPFEISVRAADEQMRERRRLWHLIRKTPRLDWLVLTKRPGNMQSWRLPERHDLATGEPLPPPPNLWLGVSVWDQASADKMIPLLLEVPAAVRWVSLEPLLGPVDISAYLPHKSECRCEACWSDPSTGLDWLVVGCESRGAYPGRHCDPEWARGLADQCEGADVPMFSKQLELPTWPGRLVKSKELAAYGWPVELPR